MNEPAEDNTPKETTPEWDGSDVCVAIHTAMRKYCDTPITTAAYNLIHLICEAKLKAKHSPWRLFGDSIAEHLNHNPEVDVANIAKRAANSLDDLYFKHIAAPRRKEGKDAFPKGVRHWLYALQGTLRCFDESDWAGAVEYLVRT